MKCLLRLAARLYPSWWRRRYASEFEALIEDVKPGWRELLDVLNGAIAMQIRTLGLIPVFCALAGIAVGGLVAIRMPELYAASATIRLKGPDSADAESALAQRLAELEASELQRTTVIFMPHRGDSTQTTVRLTYMDRNPAQAQRVAEKLAGAVASGSGGRAISSEILKAPILPTSPVEPNYPMAIASGGIVGLAAGGIMVLFFWLRGRPAKAN